MNEKKEIKEKQEREKKNTILGSLLSRPEADKAYISDLQSQWKQLGRTERVKFIFGSIVGLLLFITALLMTYLLLSTIIG